LNFVGHAGQRSDGQARIGCSVADHDYISDRVPAVEVVDDANF